MIKIFIIYIVFLHSILFGCATCQLMVPTAEVSIKIDTDEKYLKHLKIKWKFSKVYTDEMYAQYDKNKNKILDKNELNTIKQAKLDYLIPRNMSTVISYAADADKDSKITIKPKYKNFTLEIINNHLIFNYEADIDIDIFHNSMLSFVFEDHEAFFIFNTSSLEIDISELYYKENLYLFVASILFQHTPFEKEITSKSKSIDNMESKQNKPIEKNVIEEPLQENILKQSIIKIKSLFESIKDEQNPLTYIALLTFAYIYGVVHALGPGHGKTLVASYFLSNERSYSKAFSVSLAIGIVHTFSAFLLTLFIYFIVNSFLTQFINDTIFYTTKISALIIIAIALYLIYKKYDAYKKLEELKKKPKFSFSTSPHVESCSCGSCKVDKNSTDTALIISAGIIPCPGTITIFIFSLSLGLYYEGFLSALVMSLGMSSVIFISAIISVMFRKKTSSFSDKFKKYLEYASLIVILLLGSILLIS